MMFETFSDKAVQLMWSMNPMQNSFIPSMQFFGILESAAVLIAVIAVKTTLWALLVILEVVVVVVLIILWAWVATVEIILGIALGFVSIGRVIPCEVILVKLNYVLISIIQSRKKRGYYKDSNKPTLLVAWLAYNIKTEYYIKNNSNSKRNKGPL